MSKQKIDVKAEHFQSTKRLVLDLGSPQSSWLNEAKCRADDIDSGKVEVIAGSDVLSKARSIVKNKL